jgi:uncharacterized protein (TIGR02453 family)
MAHKAAREAHSFSPGTLRFLRELGRHNNRAWFQEHKAEYESEIQRPALKFIAAIGPRLAKISPHLTADARPFGGSLSRIYRDTRFAKDKSPYKTNVGIHFAHDAAGKGDNFPGFYLHLAPGESMVASGIWHPDPPVLAKIRRAIVATPDTWGPTRKKGLGLGGELYARVPAGFDVAHRCADDLRRKDFYASRPFTDGQVSSPSFAQDFLVSCRSLAPLNAFLSEALQLPW